MSNNESIHKNPNNHKHTILRAGAVSLGLLIGSAPAAHASTPSHAESSATANPNINSPSSETLNQAIVEQEQKISRDIAEQIPVHFKNTIAYYHGGGKVHFYIENPLSATVTVGNNHQRVNLIGYIEPKGSGAGPVIDMFVDSPKDTSEDRDPADPKQMTAKNSVIFPPTNNNEFDTNNPVNPVTGLEYVDQGGNPKPYWLPIRS